MRRFARYPEIRFLERFYYVPPLLLAVGLFAVGSWPSLVWGFGLATTTAFHATFAINSVNHLWGTRRFATPDDSRNNLATALLALGEGWHNNHHRYPLAARNGFYWWELDATWWVIRLMGVLGLVWDIRPVPSRVYQEASRNLSVILGDSKQQTRGQCLPKPLTATRQAERRAALSVEQAGLFMNGKEAT